MVVWGYLITILYIALLLTATKLLRKITADVEIGRKVVHIGTFLLVIVAHYFFTAKEHLVILSLLFTVLTALSGKLPFFKNIKREGKGQFGMLYYSLSLLVFSLICVAENYLRGNCELTFSAFSVAFTALALGDGTASLVGSKIKSPTLHKTKTLSGTLGCCVFTALGVLALWLLGLVSCDVVALLAVAFMAGIGELTGGKLDNFVVPFLAYLTYLGCVLLGLTFGIAALIFCAVFYVAFLSKLITLSGSIAAGCIGGLFYYFGGIFVFLFLLFCYAVMLICSRIQKAKKCDVSSVVVKTKGKDFIEIFVNGFFPTLALALFAIFQNERFLTIALIALSANFVDSLSSDIGALSKTPPKDIFRRTSVEKGVSGGVTLLGTTAALIGACVFSVMILFISHLPPIYLIVLIPLAFVGTLTDSMLGSLVQAKYQCVVCGKLTEKESHCGEKTILIGGNGRINNDTVNFISSGVVFALSFVLFLL